MVVLGDPANFSRIERCKIDRTYIIIVIIKFYQYNGYQKKKDTSTDNSTNAHALSHTIQILIYINVYYDLSLESCQIGGAYVI